MKKGSYLCVKADKCSLLFATKTCISSPVRGPPDLRYLERIWEKDWRTKEWRRNKQIRYRTDLRDT